ncbi:hypothetical protein HDU97_009181 [Phlyctochytrium planicorne]|nr:hypothetical protein HDU97_009181 [Phlyctochytrium planicorne]
MGVEIPRPYQVDLFEEALKRNIIAYLETGAGKTLVSILLLEKYAEDLIPYTRETLLEEVRKRDPSLASVDESSISQNVLAANLPKQPKKVVFCVPTVPLVSQQAGKIRQNTSLSVGEYSRDDSTSLSTWDAIRWYSALSQQHVFVITPQIFLSVLRHGFLNLSSDVSLLVFDEAHHALGNHPYNLIMSEFYHKCLGPRPKVFGMTASPVCQRTSTKEVSIMKLAELQRNLDCAVVTALDRKSLLSYVPRTREFLIEYNDMVDPEPALQQKDPSPACLFYKHFNAMLLETLDSNPSFEACRDKWLNVVSSTLYELGIWCAGRMAWYLLKNCLHTLRRKASKENDEENLLTVKESLNKLHAFSIPAGADLQPGDLTPKAWTVVELLKTKLKENASFPDFRGMVFVDRRNSAAVLSDMLNVMSSVFFPNLKCAYVTGHGAGAGAMKMSSQYQKAVFQKFRDGECNMLVVTRVAEEGIDIPSCKLVVIVDIFRSNIGYIQSRGRARDLNGSEYYVFAKRNDTHTLDTLSDAKIAEILTRRAVKSIALLEPRDYLFLNGNEDVRFERDFFGQDSFVQTQVAHINQFAAESVLQRYFKRQPHFDFLIEGDFDQHSSEAYFKHLHDQGSYSEELQSEMTHLNGLSFGYVAAIELPNIRAGLRIYGFIRCTRKLACQSAALECVRYLYKQGVLNENLLPVSRAKKSIERTQHNIGSIEEDEETVTYVKTVPQIFFGSPFWKEVWAGNVPKEDKVLFFNLLAMRQGYPTRSTESPNTYTKAPDRLASFCVATEHRLTESIPPFKLFKSESDVIDVDVIEWRDCCILGRMGSLCNCTQNSVSLTSSQLSLLVQFQTRLWNMSLKPPLVKNEEEPKLSLTHWNFFVVPMRQRSSSSTSESRLLWEIDWEYVEDVLKDCKTTLFHWLQSVGEHLSTTRHVTKRQRISEGDPESLQESLQAVENLKNAEILSSRKRPLENDDSRIPYESEVEFQEFYRYVSNKFPGTEDAMLPPNLSDVDISYVNLALQRIVLRTNHNNFKYLVKSLETSMTPLSKLLVSSSEECTFLEFASKQGYTIFHTDCALVKARQISSLRSHVNMRRPILGTDEKERVPLEAFLIPDAVTVLPISSDMLARIHLLPSAIYRLMAYALMADLKEDLQLFDVRMASLLEAFTATSAKDAVNYERFETLGDSLLKFVVTFDLFKSYSNANEGELSKLRGSIVSNQNLFEVAKAFNFGGIIMVSPFRARYFQPVSDQKSPYTYNEVRTINLKRMADCVESLIGCCYVESGLELACRFLQNVGILSPGFTIHSSLPTMAGKSLDLSSSIPAYFALKVQLLSKQIGYHFNNNFLVYEAMTHSSYTEAICPSYERLEFLGDAIIDWIAMSHFFSLDSTYSSERLSELKVSTVNNDTFCRISLSLGLNDLILLSDSDKRQEIYSYAKSFTAANQAPDQDILLDAPKVLGDAFESLVAAIFIDCGCDIEKTRRIVLPILQPYMDIFVQPDFINKSPIRRMHEFFSQAGFKTQDVWYSYKDTAVANGFECSCLIQLMYITIGKATGNTRAVAKRQAALNALDWIDAHSQEISDLLQISQTTPDAERWSKSFPVTADAGKKEELNPPPQDLRESLGKLVDSDELGSNYDILMEDSQDPQAVNNDVDTRFIDSTFELMDRLDQSCQASLVDSYTTLERLMQQHFEEERRLRDVHNRNLASLLGMVFPNV